MLVDSINGLITASNNLVTTVKTQIADIKAYVIGAEFNGNNVALIRVSNPEVAQGSYKISYRAYLRASMVIFNYELTIANPLGDNYPKMRFELPDDSAQPVESRLPKPLVNTWITHFAGEDDGTRSGFYTIVGNQGGKLQIEVTLKDVSDQSAKKLFGSLVYPT
jgi:hypothetical protein